MKHIHYFRSREIAVGERVVIFIFPSTQHSQIVIDECRRICRIRTVPDIFLIKYVVVARQGKQVITITFFRTLKFIDF